MMAQLFLLQDNAVLPLSHEVKVKKQIRLPAPLYPQERNDSLSFQIPQDLREKGWEEGQQHFAGKAADAFPGPVQLEGLEAGQTTLAYPGVGPWRLKRLSGVCLLSALLPDPCKTNGTFLLQKHDLPLLLAVILLPVIILAGASFAYLFVALFVSHLLLKLPLGAGMRMQRDAH